MIELLIWLVVLVIAVVGPLALLRLSTGGDGAGVMMALLLWLLAAVAFAVALVLRAAVWLLT